MLSVYNMDYYILIHDGEEIMISLLVSFTIQYQKW